MADKSSTDTPLEKDEAAATPPIDDTLTKSGAQPDTDSNLEAQQDGNSDDGKMPKRSGYKIALIMVALCLAVFLAAIDSTIVTTALPTISDHFHSSAGYTWIGSAYLLASAAVTPVWGKISDIFGRKPMLILANVVFFIGALVAGLSNSIGMLIAARAVQGVGGGGLLVLVNIVIGDLFSARDRGAFYGAVGGVWALALSLGPIFGGLLAERVSWRWCFYINLPFDGLALAILIVFLDVKTPKTPIIAGLKAIDWLGALLIVGGTLTFLFGIEFGGEEYPWNSAAVINLIVFGLVIIALFVVVQWKFAKYPTVPLRLFRNTTAVVCYGICFLHGLVFINGLYYLPLYFQTALGATPILSGVYLLASAIAIAFSAAACGAYINASGNPRPPIWISLFLMTLGFGLFIDLKADSNWAKIILYQIIAGLGIGALFQAPLIALQNVVSPGDVAVATSAFEFIRNLASAISIVVGAALLNNKIQSSQAELSQNLPAQVVQALVNGGAGAATQLVNSLPPMQKEFAQSIYGSALQPVWIFCTPLAGFGLLISVLVARKELSREHEETETGLEAEERKAAAYKARKAEAANKEKSLG